MTRLWKEPKAEVGSQFLRSESIVTWSHLLKQHIMAVGTLGTIAHLTVEKKQRKKGMQERTGGRDSHKTTPTLTYIFKLSPTSCPIPPPLY